MKGSVMSGLLRFSLEELAGEILQRMRDLCLARCVQRGNEQS